MPRRRRWTPVKGTGNRIYDARERVAAAALDVAGRAWFAAFGSPARADGGPPRDLLVLRLDRIGDLVMSLPALHDLRRAFPAARVRLAVGAWSEEIARTAPVDEVLVWSAPWAGRPHEGALGLRELRARAQALRVAPPDVAIDLQGDVRASWLMHETGARRRVGYANTGGAYLLSDVVPLDETVSWVEQNRRAVAVVAGPPAGPPVFDPLTPETRAFAERLFATLHLASKRPLVGIHPSGGRRVKQWEVARWAAVGRRLQEEHGATVLITGGASDRPLAAEVALGLRDRPIDLTGRLGVVETLSVIAAVDLFLSPDTGPMHMACAVGTPSVSVFGPSDPRRYFSGGTGAAGERHVVVRHDLWCAPCNLIRKPPAECAGGEPPECLREVSVDAVYAAADRLLRAAGAAPVTALVVWGRDEAPPPDGRRYVRWADERAAARDAADEAAMAWTKELGRRPWRDGRSLRDLLVWREIPLWWFAELYLYHSTEAPARVRTIETAARVLERERPDEVEAIGLGEADALLLARTCQALGVLFLGRSPSAPRSRTWRASWTSRLNTAKTLASAAKAMLVRPPPAEARAPGERTVLFLSHAAFWKERAQADTSEPEAYEHYFDRLIPEIAREPGWRARVLAVGPGTPFRRRGRSDLLRDWLRLRADAGPYVHANRFTNARVLREVWQATRDIRALWRGLSRSPARAGAFTHRGVPFGDLSDADLAGTLLLQLPWAVRSVAETREALAHFRPDAVCLYAESSGWGRAALLACRAADVPTVAVQHGIVYPKYFSYRHEPDERDCPRPDRTAVFGAAARRLLTTLGGYAPESLVLTGSPRFDDLLTAARTWDRGETRRRLGVAPEERLLVVASRFRAIRDTHASIGSAFPDLVRAVEERADTRAIVKPHPAEGSEGYAAVLHQSGARRFTLVDPRENLLRLLHAADALVTVESLSAVEALVLGRPVIVLNLPTHLSDLVSAGVALGVPEGGDPREALAGALAPGPVREGLDRARDAYLGELAMGVDGGATARIVALLRDTANRRPMVA